MASTTSPTSPHDWHPTAEARKRANLLRVIAGVLWALAIGCEAVAIFWLLKQRDVVGADGALRRDPQSGLLTEGGGDAVFPQWAFITLLVLLVVIAALSIVGSILWKRANRLDPARRSDTVRFFVQNQLGAIIAVVAFLPLIVMVFLNKDMDKGQKTIAGAVGIVLAVIATIVGVDVNPPSVEKYTADQSTVIQLLGDDAVTWVDGGKVYHVCDQVSDIQTGSEIRYGTTAEAVASGKQRLTLKFASELERCGLPVPANATEISDALRRIQSGQTVALPAPQWADGEAPIVIENAPS
ncbi:hypothetical protein [Microbacterium sp. USHLN186]|uniref:hypothetical protein n=1 Tax=Microbacterium sp. USHLN186 TaxID=3081286 RepID=UPI00301AA6F4